MKSEVNYGTVSRIGPIHKPILALCGLLPCRIPRHALFDSRAALDLTRLAEFFEPPLRSVLCTPLSRNDRLLGVLTAYADKNGAFRDYDCYVFEQIGDALVDRLCRTSAIDQSRTLAFRHRTR